MKKYENCVFFFHYLSYVCKLSLVLIFYKNKNCFNELEVSLFINYETHLVMCYIEVEANRLMPFFKVNFYSLFFKINLIFLRTDFCIFYLID